MKYIKISAFSCLIFIVSFLASCRSNFKKDIHLLDTVERIISSQPDSAMVLLNSIPYLDDLNKKQQNRYILLQIQANDKTYRDISSDTIIFRVKDYYINQNNIEKAALASFYSGRVLQEQNKDEQAINEYLLAKKYAKQTNDDTLKGLIENAMGAIFLKQFLETDAIKHFTKAIRHFNVAKSVRNEIITYNQIGNAYLMKSVSDSAFFYYKKGIELAKVTNDSLQMANITQCIGIAYEQIGNLDLAIKSFRDAGKYIGNNDYKAKLYLNLSKTFYEIDIQDSAKFYVNESLAIAQADDINLLANIYKTLSQIAKKQGDCNQSLFYYTKYTEYIEQIIDENKNIEIIELQKKYKYELIQNENNRLKIKEQKAYLLFAIIIILLCLVVVVFYKKSLSNKKKTLEKEKEILEAEKKIYQLIEMSDNYDVRENSFRGVLLHHFDILKKAALLKQYLKNNDEQDERLVKKVNEIVYGQESLNWDILYQDMDKIYNGRFERLRTKYSHLDDTEFRVCCLTYANLTCSEIGIILDLSPNTVQMKRSSIRKKMGIAPQGNIQDYIDVEI